MPVPHALPRRLCRCSSSSGSRVPQSPAPVVVATSPARSSIPPKPASRSRFTSRDRLCSSSYSRTPPCTRCARCSPSRLAAATNSGSAPPVSVSMRLLDVAPARPWRCSHFAAAIRRATRGSCRGDTHMVPPPSEPSAKVHRTFTACSLAAPRTSRTRPGTRLRARHTDSPLPCVSDTHRRPSSGGAPACRRDRRGPASAGLVRVPRSAARPCSRAPSRVAARSAAAASRSCLTAASRRNSIARASAAALGLRSPFHTHSHPHGSPVASSEPRHCTCTHRWPRPPVPAACRRSTSRIASTRHWPPRSAISPCPHRRSPSVACRLLRLPA